MNIDIGFYADECDLAVYVTYADHDRLSPTCSELRIYFPERTMPWLLSDDVPWLMEESYGEQD